MPSSAHAAWAGRASRSVRRLPACGPLRRRCPAVGGSRGRPRTARPGTARARRPAQPRRRPSRPPRAPTAALAVPTPGAAPSRTSAGSCVPGSPHGEPASATQTSDTVRASANRGHAVARPPSVNGVAASPPARKARRSSTLASSNHADNARMASCAPGGAQPASTRTCHNVVAATPRCARARLIPGRTRRPYALPASAPRASSSDAEAAIARACWRPRRRESRLRARTLPATQPGLSVRCASRTPAPRRRAVRRAPRAWRRSARSRALRPHGSPASWPWRPPAAGPRPARAPRRRAPVPR